MIINTSAYSRAGLIGNPSDGYFGKTISLILKNFKAEITLYESPEINIIPNERDKSMLSKMQLLLHWNRQDRLGGGYLFHIRW